MRILLEPELLRLGEIFARGGVELFAVGGWVRDRLLNRPVYDLDIAAGAESAQVEAICREHPQLSCSARDAGLAALTVHYDFDGVRGEAEFTAFRKESSRRDGSHRPLRVEGGATLEEDASRRDFTINALYARLSDGDVLDPLKGMNDLSAHLLRTTRTSDDVFAEDALRLLRLARFACELGFPAEKETWTGACRQAAGLKHIVPSRVGQELSRILLADHRQPAAGGEAVRQGLSLLRAMGAFPSSLPELPAGNLLESGIAAAARAPQRLRVRLAALCCGMETQRASELCLRLGLGKNMAQRVQNLLTFPQMCSEDDELALRLAQLGEEAARDYVDLQYACAETKLAQNADRILTAMVKDGLPFTPDALAISGREIAEIMGGTPGPKIGHMKRTLWKSVIQRKTANEPSALRHTIKQLTAHPEDWDDAENKEENVR